MQTITWEQFKKLVDKELMGANPEIDYIDTMVYPEAQNLSVHFNKDENSVIIH